MSKVVFLKDAEPFKLYRYAKPAKAIERDILVMPVGENYSQTAAYFIEIYPKDYIQVQAYRNETELLESDKRLEDIDFDRRLIRSIFDKKIAGERESARDIRIYSNAAIEFLARGGFI